MLAYGAESDRALGVPGEVGLVACYLLFLNLPHELLSAWRFFLLLSQLQSIVLYTSS